MNEQNNLFPTFFENYLHLSNMMTYEELIKRTKRRVIKMGDYEIFTLTARITEYRDTTTAYEFYLEDEIMIVSISPIMLVDYDKTQEEFINDWYKEHKLRRKK